MPRPIPPTEIVTIIRGLLTFPFPQVCRHLVALNLLELLQEHGAVVPEDLARAVCRAEDAAALDALSRWDVDRA